MRRDSLQVFEFDIVRKLRQGQDMASHLTHDEFEELSQISPTLPNGMLEWQGSDAVRFKQFVGNIFLSSGRSIEILPKVNKSTDNKVCRASLLYMLEHTYKLKISSTTTGSSELFDYSLQDIFIRHWCTLLEDELHKGYIRTYISTEDNLNCLKGRLKFNDHIRYNHSNAARFYCEFDEFSHDNAYNRQIKAILAVLKHRVSSFEIERHIDDLFFAFDEVTTTPLNTLEVERFHFTRFSERYRPIFALALLILEGKAPNMSTGEHSAPAMLFDMNKLFEEFVAVKLAHEFNEINQNGEHKAQFTVSEQYHVKKLGVKHFQLKPDIAVIYDNKVIAILDTKWKNLKSSGVSNISGADVYQMYAYAQRFNCQFNSLLYPMTEGNQSKHVDSLYLDDKDDKEAKKCDLYVHFLTMDFNTKANFANSKAQLNSSGYVIDYEQSEFKKELVAIVNQIKKQI